MAADKYLLHGFSKKFFGYITTKLNAESSCLIYDQLIKIGEREEISLASVRTVIIENSQTTFESDHFTQIDQETLISLLSLDELSIDEIDLMAAVSKWVDCEVQRQGLSVNRENRQKVFEPVKGYILFTGLTPEKFASSKEIAELLTFEERGSLALHLLFKDNLSAIERQTERRVGYSFCSVFVNDTRHFADYVYYVYEEEPTLSANRRVTVRTIYTTYSERAEHLRLKILDENLVSLGLKIESLVQDGRLCFSIKSPFVMEPNESYTLSFIGDGNLTSEDQQSKQLQLNYKDLAIFYISDASVHCIRGLEFCLH